MMMHSKVFRAPLASTLAALGIALALGACSSKKEEPDCVPAPEAAAAAAKKPKMISRPLIIDEQAGKKDNDWCRACVMGTKGYASCQRVYGDTPTEPRDAIKERARKRACADSGYAADACPENATIGIVCKGDPPPANSMAPGEALQNLFIKATSGGANQGASQQPKTPAVE